MKRCRTCNRTYTDPNLTYCIDDGTPLTTDVADDESTVVTPPANDGRSTNDEWNAVAYRPPSGYVPPGAMPAEKGRRVWPWAVGLLAAFILGAIALTVVAVMFVPRAMRSRQPDSSAVAPIEEPDSPADPSAAAPTDEAQVLAELTKIEQQWTDANLHADKRMLGRILADDYVGPKPGPEGGLQGKKEYIDTIQPATGIERWEFSDLKLALFGDRATLSGKITYFGKQPEQKITDGFTDKFVWREGRWQATGSEVYQVQ
ncbi:MAG TPA: nuclear transport factor 2 family protein [Pyrinomonadaceae bacterium]|nr:nuclear transport factor 2 family protein [Pyrinomonadaceae bacterium]